jgi:hypothetical protein
MNAGAVVLFPVAATAIAIALSAAGRASKQKSAPRVVGGPQSSDRISAGKYCRLGAVWLIHCNSSRMLQRREDHVGHAIDLRAH